MQCPKCKSDMEEVEIDKVDVKRCSLCKGLWFDRKKHEFLREQKNAAGIDIGDKNIGKAFDKIDDIFCPDCFAPMIKMVVADQQHIHYESCSKCYSVFFDAGEFKDYLNKNIIDFFKDLFAKER